MLGIFVEAAELTYLSKTATPKYQQLHAGYHCACLVMYTCDAMLGPMTADKTHLFVFSCSLTYGGSLIRPESTGYGTVYFVQEVLKDQDSDLKVDHNAAA